MTVLFAYLFRLSEHKSRDKRPSFQDTAISSKGNILMIPSEKSLQDSQGVSLPSLNISGIFYIPSRIYMSSETVFLYLHMSELQGVPEFRGIS